MRDDTLRRMERAHKRMFALFLFAWVQAVVWMAVALWALR
jgi:hypothetical protein